MDQAMGIGQTAALGGIVTALGMGVVFVGLVMLVFMIMLMSAILKKFDKTKPVQQTQTAAPAVLTPVVAINEGETVAAISAALAETMGTSVQGLRILSIKRTCNQSADDQGTMVAAVSAAIAETMGAEVAAIRINSIKKM